MKRHCYSESAEPSTTLGLGLYITREVATAYGGIVTVATAGHDATFNVQLPKHGEGA